MWRPRVSTALPQSLHFRLLSFHSVSDKGKPPPGRIFPNTHTWSLSIMRHCSGTAGIVTHALRSIALKLHPIAVVLLRFVLIHDPPSCPSSARVCYWTACSWTWVWRRSLWVYYINARETARDGWGVYDEQFVPGSGRRRASHTKRLPWPPRTDWEFNVPAAIIAGSGRVKSERHSLMHRNLASDNLAPDGRTFTATLRPWFKNRVRPNAGQQEKRCKKGTAIDWQL